MRVLVTGANGLIGRAVCSVLDQTRHEVTRAVRNSSTPLEISMGELNENTNWSYILDRGFDAVVHLAGQVPDEFNRVKVQSGLYHQVNTLGTSNLARQCAKHGVKRFVFISSVKVLGDGREEPYQRNDSESPTDAYAVSKWKAEQTLRKISVETQMEVVIIRPPLVYGPGVRGNFLRLIQAIDNRRPLPVGAIHNQRSLIYLDNLADVIRISLVHPAAVGKTFLASDGDDISTQELVRRLARELGCKPILLPFPTSWMECLGNLFGKQDVINRMIGSLTVNITPLKEELGWQSPYTMEEGLAETVKWYRDIRMPR